MNHTVTAAWYSPTGGTKTAVLGLAAALAAPAEPQTLDLSSPVLARGYDFGPEDLVVFGGPVFGGVLPAPAELALRTCRGHDTPAVICAVYGNRAFDDALVQLYDQLTAQGFQVIAGAGLLARHTLALSVAQGRPDADDFADYHHFADAIRTKLESENFQAPELPGHRPYKTYQKPTVTPLPGDACTHCGLCAAQCPVLAIDPQTLLASTDRCFLCMRCVLNCPAHARALAPEVAQGYEQKLSPLAAVRRPNELFL